jgi:hypothetical protein
MNIKQAIILGLLYTNYPIFDSFVALNYNYVVQL